MAKITPLGVFLRKLRVDRHQRIYDMAQATGRTTSFISAMELGKKAPPDDFVEQVIRNYNLSVDVQREIREAARLSATNLKIGLEGRSKESRELALAFARQFPSIDDEKAKTLLSFLEDVSNER